MGVRMGVVDVDVGEGVRAEVAELVLDRLDDDGVVGGRELVVLDEGLGECFGGDDWVCR